MRLLISVLMMGQLMACMGRPGNGGDSASTQYHPLPLVEVSILTARDRIISVYVRHSRDTVLFRVSPENPDDGWTAPLCSVNSVVNLSSPTHIPFCSTRYETFTQSFDVFSDGTVVLVPLAEDDRKAGVFVNLVSGKRYFFTPPLRSPDSFAKIHWLAHTHHELRVILPEDRKAQDRLPQFPEFQR